MSQAKGQFKNKSASVAERYDDTLQANMINQYNIMLSDANNNLEQGMKIQTIPREFIRFRREVEDSREAASLTMDNTSNHEQ
jgi:hypothetical protein